MNASLNDVLVDQLLAVAKEEGFDNLDDAVRNHFIEKAQEINNNGLTAQIRCLLSEGYTEKDLREMLGE